MVKRLFYERILVVLLCLAVPQLSLANRVLVEFSTTTGASLVARGDPTFGYGERGQSETRKRVEERARNIEIARTELLSALDPDLVAAVFGDYRHFPLIHVDADEDQIRRLEAHSQVVAVHEDRIVRMRTESSLFYMGADHWHTAGYEGDGTAVAVLDSPIAYWDGSFGECDEPGDPGCRVIVFENFATGEANNDPFVVHQQSYGHGTNVGGIVGDVAPGTALISLNVFAYYEPDSESGFRGDTYATDGDVIRALDWVIEHQEEYNIVAANMSLGSEVDPEITGYCTGWVVGGYAVAFANTRDAGVVPVVASGNDYAKTTIAPPACVSSAVAVGAGYDDPAYGFQCGTGPVVPGSVVCFADTNALIDFIAPGVDITAAGITMQGTSQAAPHVAGLVALYQARSPTTPLWVIERIRADAVPTPEIGPEQEYTHRYVRVGDWDAVLSFDSGAVLFSEYSGLQIRDGRGAPTVASAEVVCESELCLSDTVGFVYLDLAIAHTRTRDLVIELEAPDGRIARHEVVSEEELGLRNVNSIIGSQHLPNIFDSLSGSPVEGTWTLRVADDEQEEEGRLYQAVLLIDSIRVELRAEFDTFDVARPDEPFDVVVTLSNGGNLNIESAELTVDLVDQTTGEVVDSQPLSLSMPSVPGDIGSHQVTLQGPQGAYELQLGGTLDPDVAPGLVFESTQIDISYRTFASFEIEPGNPEPGEEVLLNIISRGLVESASWDFGDGETSEEGSPSHTWAEPGFYSVELTVVGPDGVSTTARTIVVGDGSPESSDTDEVWRTAGGACGVLGAGSRYAGGTLFASLILIALLLCRRRRVSLRWMFGLLVVFALGCVACDETSTSTSTSPSDSEMSDVEHYVGGPWVSLLDPLNPTIGDAFVYIMVSSEETTTCDLSLEYRLSGEEYQTVTVDDSTPTTGLEASPAGVEHGLLWRTLLDIPDDEDEVQIRVQATCDDRQSLPVESTPFMVLNFFESHADAVLIVEVSTADDNVPAPTNADYIELLNMTEETISLDGWVMEVGSASSAPQEFVLDGGELEPYGRLIIAELGSSIENAFELEEELPWSVEYHGYVAISASYDRGLDFVRWGGSSAVPSGNLSWTDDSPLPTPQTLTVLTRADESVDTDRSSDFCIAVPTPGAENVGCFVEREESDLIITELDSQNTNDRVEILNTTDTTINLSGWVLLWDAADLGSDHVAIPEAEIEPGQRIVLEDNGRAGREHDGILQLGVNLNIDGLVPIALALQDPHGQVIDFLAGGGSPIRWADWNEDGPTPMPGPETTISRRLGDPDTNSASDFCMTRQSTGQEATECLVPQDVPLTITEVMPGRPDWFEIFNYGEESIDLSHIYLSYQAPFYDGWGGSIVDFQLRGTVEAGTFMIVTEELLETVANEDQFLLDRNVNLDTTMDGCVSLRDSNGFGIDFVMWGEPAGRPLWPTEWNGLGYDLYDTDGATISLQRYPHDAEDTDRRDDWCWAEPSPNDLNKPCE